MTLIRLSLLVISVLSTTAQTVPSVAPAGRRCVTGERVKLSPDKPRTWVAGTVLAALAANTKGIVPAPDAFDPKSLVIRSGSMVLNEGSDYLVDPAWGTIGLAPGSRVTSNDTVAADYCYSLRRLDALVGDARGRQSVIPGESALTDPLPAAVPPGMRRIANLYVPYFSDGRQPELFRVEEAASAARTSSTPARIPRTLEKIRTGQPVKIVTWGDSVTEGGDASTPQQRYTAVFARMLQAKFPAAPITVDVVAVGGSSSRQWLYPERYPSRLPSAADRLRWQRVVDAKPDLVTIEFVNDAGLKPEEVTQVYGDILERLRAIGSEVILITPHFTRPAMMNFRTLRDRDERPYVLALRDFARDHGLALADAAARWEHLAQEGIPYVTLLHNGINHPDDRGHLLFAEELLRCFAPR